MAKTFVITFAGDWPGILDDTWAAMEVYTLLSERFNIVSVIKVDETVLVQQ